ncbi:uncharacterized protein PHA67_007789 isoform 1-T1 [Liasis olivaceus]
MGLLRKGISSFHSINLTPFRQRKHFIVEHLSIFGEKQPPATIQRDVLQQMGKMLLEGRKGNTSTPGLPGEFVMKIIIQGFCSLSGGGPPQVLFWPAGSPLKKTRAREQILFHQ